MKKIILALSVMLMSINIFAAEASGTAAAPYLNLGVGARACGMGEAYTAVVRDVEAVWWNPGALVKVESPQFSIMHNQNFGGTLFEFLSVGFPAEQLGLDLWGTIGISVLYIAVEDIFFTKEEFVGGIWDYSWSQDQRGEYKGAGGTMLGVSYSWQAAKMFAVGATIKMINQSVAGEGAWLPALDIGILSHTNFEGFDLGLVFQNLSFMQLTITDPNDPEHNLNVAPLPLNIKFAISLALKPMFTSSAEPRDGFTFGLDGILPIQPANLPFKLNVGLEYMFDIGGVRLSPRGGYRFNGKDFISDLGPLAGMTAGFGISKNFDGLDVSIDYAFTPYGVLGQSHKIGMLFNVGAATPTPTPVAVKPPKVVKLKPQKKKIWVMWSVDKKNVSKIKGYNVYMSYKPGGKYYKLTKTPIPPSRYYLKVGPLKSGLRSYFVVTAVNKDGKESKYSREISAVPR